MLLGLGALSCWHVWGILPGQLAWARYAGKRTRSSRRFGGPSWSLGSVNQPCTFQHVVPWDRIRTRFKLVDSLAVLKTEDPNGPEEMMARLTISGPMVKGNLAMQPNWPKENDIFYMTYAGQGHADEFGGVCEDGGEGVSDDGRCVSMGKHRHAR